MVNTFLLVCPFAISIITRLRLKGNLLTTEALKAKSPDAVSGLFVSVDG
jgi:hypothetical protein